MNRRQVSALLVLRELGITPQMHSFDDRLSVQKSIYLAQAAGVDLGHYFNWYLRGPYSPALTQDVFEAIQNYDTTAVLQGWELDAATRTKLGSVRSTFASAPGLAAPAWLELLASVHFLLARRQVASADAEVLRAQLLKYSKNFTSEQIAEGVRRLVAAGLVAPQS